jgi:4-alpha-glucanotransferase/(1->4)-alpha-D-glucan 1-alpha-D-glucosylmutase
MPSDALDELCERSGIERVYHDGMGERHEVDAETIRALAGAIGISDNAESTARKETPLEPVTVWRVEDGPPEIMVTLSAAMDETRIAWELVEEMGQSHAGEEKFAPLDLVESFELGGRQWQRRKMRLPLPPLGYHRLRMTLDGTAASSAEALLIVVPSRAYLPPELESGSGLWGISVQLYAVRSHYDWGIGDFGDLTELVRRASAAGAGAVGLNPLHALYLDEPERASPYSPSSRIFLNPLYIDVEAVPDYAECDAARRLVNASEFQTGIHALRSEGLVDYVAVAQHKRSALALLYGSFRQRHLARQTGRGRAFRAFQRGEGEALRRFAIFQVLRETRARDELAQRYWRNWPAPYCDPTSPAVARFAAQNAQAIEFFEYLQWIAHEQLAGCAAAARDAGMPIGLYRDLAVGVDAGAGEAWAAQETVVGGWSVGAPPDAWNRRGQDWGLAPLSPVALRRAQYRPFVDIVRANMRHAGALRIDHVLGLWRSFWIRHGDEPVHGAYVRYPFSDLIGILALESHRAKCVVIGEDLGTVPDGLRAELERAGILSYRLLYFERDENSRFRPPQDYPRSSLVAVSTHDLPTLPAYWSGADIALQAQLGFLGDADKEAAERQQRQTDLAALSGALREQGLIDDGIPEQAPVEAAYRFLARTPGRVVMVHLEDALGITDQVNVPGTLNQHPNWQRRWPVDLAAIFRDARVRSLFRALASERPSPHNAVTSALATPVSTYRLQFNPRFTLKDALALVPYLASLGISHVYASPLLKARPGSEHGYDITDHNALNPEIGDWDDFVRFTDALRKHAMGLVLDFVPNHMGIGKADNTWWLDVLEWGQGSIYSDFFDIDWTPHTSKLHGKLLLPLLGDHYGAVLERGDLVLQFAAEEGSLSVWYHEHRLPLRPRSYAAVIRRQLAQAETAHRLSEEQRAVLDRIAGEFDLVRRTGRRRRDEARKRAAALKAELADLCRDSPTAEEFMTSAAAAFNGEAGNPGSFRLLHSLLERQHYRLAFWRVAADEINYRRFFNINELAGIRMENRALFDIAHRLIGRMIAEGRLHGLRLDHIDGLFDPAAYFRRLQAFARMQGPAQQTEATNPFYIVVEKILARHESLRASWPIAGTTGYDFANLVNGVFVDAAGEQACGDAYRGFGGIVAPFDDILLAAKDTVIDNMLSGELGVLANELDVISESHWGTRDYTMHRLRETLAAVVRYFPVYRTYVTGRQIAADDRRDIDWAVSQARRSWHGPDREIIDFVQAVLTGDLARRGRQFRRADVLRFAMRFQQYTGPIMAKSLEDTAFYRYHNLISLNEVGGDPRLFGVSVAAFHHANRERARQWPQAMLATTTHDTKRGEDARARIDVLSEMPDELSRRAMRWAELNRFLRPEGDVEAPTRNDEYLLYQTLLGAWPAEFVATPPEGAALARFSTRIEQFTIKAVREAKLVSSWDNPNEAYENACVAFLRGALDDSRPNPFLADFAGFAKRIAFFGMLNGLSQAALRLTVPGVPDTYQGTELWDLSLVDPDNRRPVDFGQRMELVEALSDEGAGDALRGEMGRWPDGQVKFHVLHRLLALRRERPSLFLNGSYEPLAVDGSHADHLLAFQRRYRGERLIVAAGRLFVSLLGSEAESYEGSLVWGDTAITLPPDLRGRWRDVLSGATCAHYPDETSSGVEASGLLSQLPVAVLLRERD